jgi:hypothetical protein
MFEMLLCFHPGVGNACTVVDPGKEFSQSLDLWVRVVPPQASTRVGTFSGPRHLRMEAESTSEHCAAVVH